MDSTQKYIVVEPANHPWRDGTLREGQIVGQNEFLKLKAAGVVMLPYAEPLAKLSGVGGYHRRAWGEGITLNGLTPRMACPLTVFLTSQQKAKLSWCALAVPDAETMRDLIAGRRPYTGRAQLAGDQSQAIAAKIVTTGDGGMVQFDGLGMPQFRKDLGGFLIGGETEARVPMDGHYGLGIYGMGRGLRVVWAAVAQAAMDQASA
jgi:hypothetical protein